MAINTVKQNSPEKFKPAYSFEPYGGSRKEVDKVCLPGDAIMRFVDLTNDVAGGAKSIIELMTWNNLTEDFLEDSDSPETELQPVISNYHRERLERLVAASLGMLEKESERIRQWAFEQHTPEGQQEVARYHAWKSQQLA